MDLHDAIQTATYLYEDRHGPFEEDGRIGSIEAVIIMAEHIAKQDQQLTIARAGLNKVMAVSVQNDAPWRAAHKGLEDMKDV